MPMKDRLEELQQAQRELLLENSGKKTTTRKSSNKMTKEKTVQNFLVEVGIIDTNLTQMKNKIIELKRIQLDLLSTPFCERSKIVKYESMGEDIRHSANKVGRHLEQLKIDYNKKDIEGDSTLLRVSEQQMSTLSTELNLATNELYKTQTEYMDKMKARLQRQLKDRGDSSADDSRINEILQQDSHSVFTSDYMLNVQSAEQTLRDVEDRKTDILKLEKDVSCLNQLFSDLNLMVIDQGEPLSTIEQALDSASNDAEHGRKYLEEALRLQAKARRRKICILLVVLTVLVILGVILTVVFVANEDN